ncbi:hypothetical protein GOB94_06450 [Granulicella sp. 5B5]|uniref:hypothetical protein n=1 Tax=Granulicella sp. 5B5 TaxID=1617967 RepID=UPI0015F61947|nr:hypothetical protein [Granulicella sp. 5B5]QMV18364.1 hypothetical protein GOB94_06450 [Granulicella sp. 5B5]
MTSAIFYMSSIVFSGVAIFALWQFGLKKLMLDDFRDALFAVRDRLYALAQDGRISCSAPAYRSVEVFINRTIRYAHHFTFLSFAMSVWHMQEASERENAGPPSEPMFKQVEALKDEDVKRDLISIIEEVSDLLPRYIAKSSLMFMIGSLIYVVFRSVSPIVARSKQKAVETFEVEAYRDEKFSHYSPA